MAKRIAVIVRDRQSEALRMSIGLTILEDEVEIYLVKPLRDEDEMTLQLEGVRELSIPVFSIFEESGFEDITIEEMAGRLLRADNIIAY
ncbi:MAG: hypothetical protein ACK4Z9_01510 [Thermodesulfovibrionales bacterium]